MKKLASITLNIQILNNLNMLHAYKLYKNKIKYYGIIYQAQNYQINPKIIRKFNKIRQEKYFLKTDPNL